MFVVCIFANFRSGKILMSWTPDRDVIFCREILVSNLFNTKKSSTERGKVWESLADKLCDIRQPSFRVDQRSVRDHYKKLISKYKRKVREELNASGTSPEQSELDVMLEEIVEREELCEAEKENDNENRKKMEADRLAADDVRRKAMETLSETQNRIAEEGQKNLKKKTRRSGDGTVAYLREKAEMEMNLRKEEMDLRKAEIDLENDRKQHKMEQQGKIFEQQANMMKAMIDQQQQQQQQRQAMHMMMLHQQQQQNQALMALLEKLSK